jgi:hypothetical protein
MTMNETHEKMEQAIRDRITKMCAVADSYRGPHRQTLELGVTAMFDLLDVLMISIDYAEGRPGHVEEFYEELLQRFYDNGRARVRELLSEGDQDDN